MRQLMVALAGVLMLLGASARAEEKPFIPDIDYGRYFALVIGNNDYQKITKLQTAVADAGAMAEVLSKRYGMEVELLLDATRQAVIDALLRYRAKLTERDNLLIYYAGHGFLDLESDSGFWLPIDADRDSEVNWIDMTTLVRNMRAMATKHVIVIADSCFSGTLVRAAPAVKLDTAKDKEVWFERMGSKRARTALTSGGIEPVVDGGGKGHSIFTQALLDALQGNKDVITGDMLFSALRGMVVMNADQTPQYSDVRLAGHEGGDFLFRPLKEVVTASPADPIVPAAGAASQPPSDPAMERVFWEAIKDSKTPAMYEAFLQQFPNGVLAPLARVMVETLKKPSQEAALAPGGGVTLAPQPPPPPMSAPPAKDASRQPGSEFGEVEELVGLFDVVAASNIRDRPAASSKKIGRVDSGGQLLVTGKVGSWYRVETPDGGSGYVYAELLSRSKSSTPGPAAPPAPPSVAQVPPAQPSVAQVPPAQMMRQPTREPAPQAAVQPPIAAPPPREPQQVASIVPPPAPAATRAGSFRDCPSCPEMASMPLGSFTMGSRNDPSEQPPRTVTIKRPFAIGLREVTVGEWRACVEDNSCTYQPGNRNAAAPMNNVSWEDAAQYVAWLSKVTGKNYRLPSEAEWEYAARGGTQTKYWWGDKIETAKANCQGCGGPWNRQIPSDSGSFPPNPFGLFDTAGSVSEFVADCWHNNLEGAPSDGSAWGSAKECRHAVLKGGSWRNDPSYLHSSTRLQYDVNVRYLNNGFRVARDLP